MVELLEVGLPARGFVECYHPSLQLGLVLLAGQALFLAKFGNPHLDLGDVPFLRRHLAQLHHLGDIVFLGLGRHGQPLDSGLRGLG